MKIYIEETQDFTELELLDKHGIDRACDYIYTHWALGGRGDDQFGWDEELEAYVCSFKTYQWWADALIKQQWIDDTINKIEEVIDYQQLESFRDELNTIFRYDDDLGDTLDKAIKFLKSYLTAIEFLKS